MVRQNRIGTDIDGEQRRQLLDLIHDPLLAVFVAAAGVPVFPAQKGAAYTAVDAVVVGGIRDADQVPAGLGNGVAPCSADSCSVGAG